MRNVVTTLDRKVNFPRIAGTGKTGVEMEALVAASVAALTIYDMGKSVKQ